MVGSKRNKEKGWSVLGRKKKGGRFREGASPGGRGKREGFRDLTSCAKAAL